MHQLCYIPLVVPGKQTILEQDLVQCHLAAQSSLLDVTLFDGFLSTKVVRICLDRWKNGKSIADINRSTIRVRFVYTMFAWGLPFVHQYAVVSKSWSAACCRRQAGTVGELWDCWKPLTWQGHQQATTHAAVTWIWTVEFLVDFPWRGWMLYWQVSRFRFFGATFEGLWQQSFASRKVIWHTERSWRSLFGIRWGGALPLFYRV